MKFKKNFMRTISCAAIILMFGACAPEITHTELAAPNSGETLRVNVGSTFTITLDENATTGYVWDFASPPYASDMILMKNDSSIFPKGFGNEKLAGAPQKRVLTFKAIGPGTTGIKLEYRRPWEKNKAPEKRFDLMIIVSGEPEKGVDLFGRPEKPERVETPRINSKGEIVPETPGLLD